ncbi:MerR family transcriptional regulator [Shewanella maritima]|uniref:MerR family transcriptional regulator n=1 Tax=Shewanella maritima TaxID=2520507 RepID=UPI0037350DD7
MDYRISQLATAVGLSRTALLYYEKLELIKGKRAANGYRLYSDKDLQRVRLIQKLQAGGLTLKECKACLEAKIDKSLLAQRLTVLESEIAQKQKARDLLAAMLGKADMKAWHTSMDADAPDAHLQWLKTQGFDEKQALRLKWLSKDMNEHDSYMADFMKVFETLERWGPGDESETLKALQSLPIAPSQILEIGCGKGLATQVLAQHSQANITAVDNEQSALDRLAERFSETDFANRITGVSASMTELPFAPKSFDLIWAEGSAYIMGVTNALEQWRPLLKQDGMMMVSDLVWLADKPHPTAKNFLQQEYPDMQTVDTRLQQITAAGYEVISHFSLSQQAWQNYYMPLGERAKQLQQQMPDSQAVKDITAEVKIYEQHLPDFGYQMFVIRKVAKA